MIAPAIPIKVLLYVGPSLPGADPAAPASVIAGLLQKGVSVKVVHDSAKLLPVNDQSTKPVVLADFQGATIPSGFPCDAIDIHGRSVPELLELIDGEPAAAEEKPKHWKPWFPVIDFKRCTNCMQCLSFCLFDVYGVTGDGRIQVQNENNCKTDCPACSRVCPEVAIMFPKYKAGPINGDEINSDDVRREGMKVDISALLGGDIYSMLRDRSAKAKSRFSKERDDERALKERQRCLDKLKSASGDFDIPAEVLASLPSADQIQMKAEQARQRAAEALERQAAVQSAKSAVVDQASAPSQEGI